jgi:hypothetical protein
VDALEMTTPSAVTTLSTLIVAANIASITIMLLMVRVNPRAIRGIGILMIALDGD